MFKHSVLSLLFFILFTGAASNSQAMPSVQLAQVYEAETADEISHYLVSEKYDGIRAIWTGEQLLTRNGHVIHAPDWFTRPLPKVWLDGELWTERQDFAGVSSIVRSQTADDAGWRTVRYMVFDMPAKGLTFAERYKNYTTLIDGLNLSHLKAVKQQRFTSNDALSQYLDTLVKNGAEGVMLHLATANHQAGRSSALLKLKPYFDDEAVVIGHLPGKGKYTNQLGALQVKNKQGIIFKIGSGFSDEERANPPAIGTIITYKYHGFTKHGLPRFASFLRIRNDL